MESNDIALDTTDAGRSIAILIARHKPSVNKGFMETALGRTIACLTEIGKTEHVNPELRQSQPVNTEAIHSPTSLRIILLLHSQC